MRMGTVLAPAIVPVRFLMRDGAGAATMRRLNGMAGELDGG